MIEAVVTIVVIASVIAVTISALLDGFIILFSTAALCPRMEDLAQGCMVLLQNC